MLDEPAWVVAKAALDESLVSAVHILLASGPAKSSTSTVEHLRPTLGPYPPSTGQRVKSMHRARTRFQPQTVTNRKASVTMAEDIFDSPSARSTNWMGTSIIRAPA